MPHSFIDTMTSIDHYIDPFNCSCYSGPHRISRNVHSLNLSQKVAVIAIAIIAAIPTFGIGGVVAFYVMAAACKSWNVAPSLVVEHPPQRERRFRPNINSGGMTFGRLASTSDRVASNVILTDSGRARMRSGRRSVMTSDTYCQTGNFPARGAGAARPILSDDGTSSRSAEGVPVGGFSFGHVTPGADCRRRN